MEKAIKCKKMFPSKGLTDCVSMLKIAVCDCDMKLCQRLEKEIAKIFKKEDIKGIVDRYLEVNQLKESKISYDIIFLFLNMSKSNGLEEAKIVKSRFKCCSLILISEETKYMQEAFKVQPFRYLLMPYTEGQLKEAICSAKDEKDDKTGLILEGEGGNYTVFKKDIVYIESLGDEIAIITQKNDYFILRMALKTMYSFLENDFLKCSREKIVNMKHILEVKEREVILDNGIRITVSHRENNNVKIRYREYSLRIAGME